MIDLVRFTELARRRGQTGLLKFLASFFKSPLGVEEHRFAHQFQMLQQWLGETASASTPPNIVQRSKSRMTNQPAEERPESPQAVPGAAEGSGRPHAKASPQVQKAIRPAAAPAVEFGQ